MSYGNLGALEVAINKAAQASVRNKVLRAAFDEVLHDPEAAANNILASCASWPLRG